MPPGSLHGAAAPRTRVAIARLYRDRAGEISGALAFRFDDLDAAFARDHRRIDVIYGKFHHRREQSFQHGQRQRRHVVLRHVTAVDDLNFFGQCAGHLRVQAAEFFRQGEIRPKHF